MPRSSVLFVAVILSAILAAGCTHAGAGFSGTGSSAASSSGPPPALAFSPFITGLSAPIGFEIAPNDSLGRIFIIEQAGKIRVIQNTFLQVAPFLDITTKVESGGEEGLLGLAFHPNFSTNGKFYANYTRRLNGQLQTVIAEYQASPPTSTQASVSSETILFTVDQPAANHNGGQLAFGSDGLLYIGRADRGGQRD